MLPPLTPGPAAPVRDVSLLIFLFVVFFILIAGGVLALAGLAAHYYGWPAGVWIWIKFSISAIPYRPTILAWQSSYSYGSALAQAGWLYQVWASDILALLISLPAATLLSCKASAPPPAEIHVAGRQLAERHKQAAKEMADESSVSGQGINIHPKVPISMDRETRHMFVLGSVGGGKTVMLLPIMQQAIARGDKCLIFDNKGDFTSVLPGLIFAPWDRRCIAWDIAADCQTKADARTVAARLITESKDPMWSGGARQLLAAIIVFLQQTRPGKWDFADVIEVSCRPFGDLKIIVNDYFPEANRTVEDMSKTTQSFLIMLSTYLANVSDLADGWRGKRKFSFRRWLLNPDSPESKSINAKTLILQGNKRFSELQKAYTQAMFSALGGIINSPELEDSSKRKIWFFLDEFPQLEKVYDFAQFLEIGRSKGLRVVIGVQDVAQLRDIYNRDTLDAWSSMVGTYLIARTQGKETPKWLSELIGTREIKRYSASFSSGSTRTDSWEHVEVPVIRPDAITRTLGPKKRIFETKIAALFHPGGDNVYRLNWPLPKKTKLRPAIILADWITRQSATGNDAEQFEGGAGIEPTPDQSKPQAPIQLPVNQATASKLAEHKVLAPGPTEQKLAPEPIKPEENPMEEAEKEAVQHAVEEVISATVGPLPPGTLTAIDAAFQTVKIASSPQGEPVRPVVPVKKNEPEMDELDALMDLLDEEDSCSP